MRKGIAIVLLIIVVALAVTWYFLIYSATTPIAKILENPRDYTGKTVQISGTVKDIFSTPIIKYYTIDDGTGEIRVITEDILPGKNTKLNARGKVDEAFAILDKRVIVLIEEK